MAKKSKILSCAVAFALTGFAGVGAADVYQLDPVTVTAERTTVTDLNTPAAVEVLYADQIAATGANNVQESLKYSTGIIASGQGPRVRCLPKRSSAVWKKVHWYLLTVCR